MRFVVWACGFLLFLAYPVRAGLYNTAEPEEGKMVDLAMDPRDWPKVFRQTLQILRTIGAPEAKVDKELRKRYVLLADLGARAPAAKLTTEQKLNLSAALIRRRKPDEAIALLTPLTRQEPKNFLLQSNLATAYHLSGQERRAIDTLEQMLSPSSKVWPAQLGDVEEPFRTYLQHIDWHDGAFAQYRRVEEHYLKLLKLRTREALARKGKGDFETVDALFDDGKSPPSPVRFVAESGKFEPGKLARAEKAKLPKDAVSIVQQLLIWLPDDLRLYWLLGELYNAQGDARHVLYARQIFEELAGYGGFGVRAQELADHRKELINYTPPGEEQPAPFDVEKKLDEIEKKKEESTRIDWQTLGVGFGTGLLVAVFGMWQIREIRRRRQARALAK